MGEIILLKKRYLFLILIVSLFALSAVSAGEITNDADIVVNDYDSGLMAESVYEYLSSDSYGTFQELQDEINAIEVGGTLNLTRDYKYVDGSTEGIRINKHITIDGQGHTIDGNRKSSIFYIRGSDVVLKNLTLMNGNANNGGGISWQGNNGTIKYVKFYNNTALEDGGAVYARGDILKIQYCNFTNNEADTGGGIYCYDTNLKIKDSYFIKNIGWDRGGAIHCRGPNSEVDNCTFIKNEGEVAGAVNFDRPNCIVNNSLFIENLAYRYGGAFWWIGIQGILNNSVFINNKASEVGKAIYWSGSKGILQNLINYHADTIYIRANNTLINCTEIYNTLPYWRYIDENNDLTKYYNESTNFTVRILKSEGGYVGANEEVNFIINDTYYKAYADFNGYAQLNETLQAGNYTVTTCYGGNEVNNIINVLPTLFDKDMNITSSDIYEIETEVINVVLPKDASGTVSTFINNKEYWANVNEGVGNIIIDDLYVGYYDIEIIYSGDYQYNSLKGNTSFMVEKYINLTSPDVTKYYNGPERLYVTLTDKNNNPIVNANVKININGVDYDRTTGASGQTSIGLAIPSGEYTATVKYDDIETESKVVIKPTISGDNITKTFRNSTQYYAKFVDTNGNILKNTQIIFNINGIFYTRTTNENGVAKLNINLNPGEYIITATNPVSTEMYSNVVTVLPNIIENHDLIKYYKNASQYVIKVLDDQGRPVSGQSVDFNINGVFYTRTSNATGHVKMNINLNPGTYIITAIYKGFMASNTIKVLSILEAKDLNMKFRDGSKFEAKLLDGQGNPFASGIVTFNINGVFYERLTDINGIARLNINLNPGDYIITSSYNGLNIANTITITPDPMYYTIGSNPLDYNYYMNEYNKFSLDWYYVDQYDSNVKTIYDIYGNMGMELQTVRFGTKYICYEASTVKEIALNSDGEVIGWTIARDYSEDYILYDQYNNIIARGHWINGEGIDQYYS
ncbi:MAG: hypothetical protein IJH63_11550 [Methanobrevibacter sp.]|nr:hypothetical protein [Methanobrevibacter sp.]